MKTKQVLICTFGDTAYQTGIFLRQHLKNIRLLSFVHSGWRESEHGIVADAGESFEQCFTQHIGQEQHPQNRLQRWWKRIFKREQTSTIFLIAGLGGRYSSCVTPEAARIARLCGYDKIISIVQMPFGFEGAQRSETARTALRKIKSYSDKHIVFDHQQLLKRHSDMLVDEYFSQIDEQILKIIHNS